MSTNNQDSPQQPLLPAPVGIPQVVIDEEVVNRSQLTPQQELYCVTLVENGNRGFAYRRAYNVGVATKPGTIWTECKRLENNPAVVRRLNELRDAAAALSTVSKQRLIQFLWDRIMADRRDVVNHVRRCCRRCYGEGHQYQWKDEMEFALSLAAVIDFNGPLPGDSPLRKELPTDEGGYGFDPHREPEPTCDSPDCMGDGFGKTVISDTTQLSGSAALIYEGVKETAQGIEVKLADRNADMAQLAKLLGWSIEKVDQTVKTQGGRELPADMYDIPSTASPEEASKRYLALVQAS
jgi:phage terminase small subunit